MIQALQLHKRRQQLLIGLFVLAVGCFLFAGFIDWRVGLLEQLHNALCCYLFPMHQGLMVGGFSIRPIVLIGGALLMASLVIALRQIWRTQRRLNQLLSAQIDCPASVAEVLQELSLTGKVVLVGSSLPEAFCFGFLKPRICITTGLVEQLSSSQLRAVLLHEEYHRRHFDPLRLLGLEALSTTLFFLPIMAELRALFRIRLELAADQYAVEGAGKPALAGALHHLLTTAPVTPLAGALTVGLTATSLRVAALLGEPLPAQFISSRSLLLSTFIITLACLPPLTHLV